MKKLLLPALLGLLVAAGQVRADGPNLGPTRIDAGFNIYFNVYTGNAYMPLAPWYTYWPYDGQYLSPGPLADVAKWNTWPGGSPIGQQPPPLSFQQQGPGVRPAAYNPNMPGYWYGR